MLTDRGSEYCGNPERHEYELYLAIEDIDHSRTKTKSPQTNGICERRSAKALLTPLALPTRFVYFAVILDAWSRRIVGYAIGRSIDARLTAAALRAAIDRRKPPPGCIHHSDSKSVWASCSRAA